MEQTESMTMGKRITAYRKGLGLTQDQLAERVGVSPQAVSKWENDLSCPDISTLPVLAEIFGVSTDELLGVPPKNTTVHQGEIVNESEVENAPQRSNNDHWELKLNSGKKHGIFFALWIIALGAMLLAGRLMRVEISFWTALWTTGLTVLGLQSLFNRFNLFGLTATAGGAYIILNTLKLIPPILSWEIVLPALILIWGLSLLFDALPRKKKPLIQINQGKSPNVHTVTDGVFQYKNSFGEDRYLVTSPLLRGGEVNVSFGEHTIDLTGCGAVAEDCQIQVYSSFGELTFLVPRRFRVELESSKAFSSIDVSGQPAPDADGIIFMDTSVSFGELKIQYV